MCGIFGYSGKNVDTSKLKILALYNQTRGNQATGIYSDTQGVIKDTLSADDFIATYTQEFICDNLFLGHTRFATHGVNSQRNAHPFTYDNVIGIHNGVLENYQEIANKYNATIEVDSQCIFMAIQQEVDEKAILPQIIGAMAIAYTKDNNTLYLYRRDNPIFIGVVDDNVYFSSIADSLVACGIRKVYTLEEHVIYTFKNGILCNKERVDKPQYASRYNWYHYQGSGIHNDRDDFINEQPYTFDELLAFGVSQDEAFILAHDTLDEQLSYLYAEELI